MPTGDFPHVNLGWECPKCGQVWAPWVHQCNCRWDTAPNTTTQTVTDTCPACGQSRFVPPLSGCPVGEHYGITF